MVSKISVVLVALIASTLGRPQEPSASADSQATILSQTESIDPDGGFSYNFETSNGIKVEETGMIKHVTGLKSRENFAADDTQPDEDDILVQTGSFSYTAPDGTVISLKYIADENGFQPIGDHLPTPPPIITNLLRTLQQNEPAKLKPQPPVTQAPAQPVAAVTESKQKEETQEQIQEEKPEEVREVRQEEQREEEPKEAVEETQQKETLALDEGEKINLTEEE